MKNKLPTLPKHTYQKKPAKYNIYILFVVIPLAVFLKLGSLIFENTEKIDGLQNRNERLREANTDIAARLKESIIYQEKLNEELAKYMDSNQQINRSIESWKNESASKSQAFHGEWWIRAFYIPDTGEWQWCGSNENLYFEKEYIFLIDSRVTDEPIYAITICERDKILKELDDMGIKDVEPLHMDISRMLNSDYYVEMDFSQTDNWNGKIKLDKKTFWENAKYYPIDLNTMLCIMRNEGGKVYLLDRIMVPGVD